MTKSKKDLIGKYLELPKGLNEKQLEEIILKFENMGYECRNLFGSPYKFGYVFIHIEEDHIGSFSDKKLVAKLEKITLEEFLNRLENKNEKM